MAPAQECIDAMTTLWINKISDLHSDEVTYCSFSNNNCKTANDQPDDEMACRSYYEDTTNPGYPPQILCVTADACTVFQITYRISSDHAFSRCLDPSIYTKAPPQRRRRQLDNDDDVYNRVLESNGEQQCILFKEDTMPCEDACEAFNIEHNVLAMLKQTTRTSNQIVAVGAIPNTPGDECFDSLIEADAPLPDPQLWWAFFEWSLPRWLLALVVHGSLICNSGIHENTHRT